MLRLTNNVVTSSDLLGHQRFGGGHKEDFTPGIPSVEIMDDNCSNKRLSKSCMWNYIHDNIICKAVQFLIKTTTHATIVFIYWQVG